MTPVFICRSIVCFLSMPIVLKQGANNTNIAEKILEDNSQYLHDYFQSEKDTHKTNDVPLPLTRLKQNNLQSLKFQSPLKDKTALPTNSPISIIPYVAESESQVINQADDAFKSNFVFVNDDAGNKVNVFKPNSPMILKVWGAGTESKFPPLIEVLVQRIQSMFSNYVYEDLSRPAYNINPENVPAATVKPIKKKPPVNSITDNKISVMQNIKQDEKDSEKDQEKDQVPTTIDNEQNIDQLTHPSIQSIQEQLTVDQMDMESRKDRIKAETIIEPDTYFETFDSDYDVY